MPSSVIGQTPSLTTFLKSLRQNDIENSIELFISLLKRRQIKNSRPCAIATTHLLLRVVAEPKRKWDAQKLIARVRHVGRRLIAAQPREMAVGNIVRRVLGVIREVAERDEDPLTDSEFSGSASPITGEFQRPALPTRFSEFSPLHGAAAMPHNMHSGRPGTADSTSMDFGSAPQRPALLSTNASYAGQGPPGTSLFSILQHPQGRSPMATPPPGTQSPVTGPSPSRKGTGGEIPEKLDIKAEVIDGIKELQDELDVVDNQIAESALDHIHSNEIILTHTSSQTVQKFLLTAARKRKFTLFHAEAYPNNHEATHATILNGAQGEDDSNERWKPLTSLGITVILIPDTAVFALMSRINKVILAPHAVLANGSLLAAAGASTIALAAKTHHVPVVVLSGVYKLSPVYPFDTDELIEYGDPSKVVPFEEAEFTDKVDIVNPLYDWVDCDLVDLYITNLGGQAPSYLYRIVADHYRVEDIDLNAKQEAMAKKG
ncbi:GCD complex subunit gcd7 [Friedmanniomyces endolithicus]|uniref:Translation initiation factor eIF2B subunit beta n=1 Tax=Friedmanniomyces endolithicus TaxID=329885 RepID=A0AAN6R1Y3_9PEZI|nr:GCD complex subunit gcd7 [Friedmanniomyces endolithicus]KAK0963561.1 GCD complex subunit gcd7 [Friedmanniomyces endolithicus]KAK1015050.1 GCD complex subunit gcd7 [Friedmanniomyces endolithicus]KAK1030110.1 GCD complex subunit gcd7 [Friedmanniomyces endolithicus]